MPLLTRLTKLQIDELVKDYYELGRVVSVWKVKNGWSNTLFKIKTTHGDFFLKVYEEVNQIQVMAEHEVVSSLVKNKFPTASIIRTKTKEGIVSYEDKLITIFNAIDGRPLATNPFKTVLGYRIVSILNLLHQTDTRGFIYLSKLDLSEHIEESLGWYLNNNKVGDLKDNLVNLFESFSDVSFLGLTNGVVHNDLGVDNFLVEGNNIKGLIDFDQVAKGSVVNDLAKFFARSVNLNVYDIKDFIEDIVRFIKDYSKKNALNEDDIHVLTKLIVFQKVLILVKIKKNIKEGSLRSHLYNFEEYASLVEKEIEILFRNYQLIEHEFNRLRD